MSTGIVSRPGSYIRFRPSVTDEAMMAKMVASWIRHGLIPKAGRSDEFLGDLPRA
jgi:hypothetical protein